MKLGTIVTIGLISCVAQIVVRCIAWIAELQACKNKHVGAEMAKCAYTYRGIFGFINCIICVYALYRMYQATKNNVSE
jgi:hypothetical protein